MKRREESWTASSDILCDGVVSNCHCTASDICKIKKNLQKDVEGGCRGSVDGNMPYFLGHIRSNLTEPQDSQKRRRLKHIVPSVLGLWNFAIFGIVLHYFYDPLSAEINDSKSLRLHLWCCSIDGLLVCWSACLLVCLSAGLMDCWSDGLLVCWTDGLLV